MSLLRDIQEALVGSKADLGAVLLKLRLLAARLGSHELEEWVKYETEGYPKDVEVPEYRRVELTYTGNFHNIAWQANNQPIPPYLIEKYCGKNWTTYSFRESAATIESMLERSEDKGRGFGIDASNLILMLQGKVYPEMNCSSIEASFSPVAFHEILNTVRARILELTIELEKQVPSSTEITINADTALDTQTQERTNQVVHMVFQGSNTVVTNSGANTKIVVNNIKGDIPGVIKELVEAGIPEQDAEEFSNILTSENPVVEGEPLGERAVDWLSRKLPVVAKGAWKISADVLTSVLTEVAKRYYGLS